MCLGKYVLALNSDDMLLPNCLEIAGKALESSNAAAAYFSTTYLTGSQVQGFHPVPKLRFADDRTLRENPWLEKFHGTSPTCCLFRKSVFDLLGGYRTSLRLAYDWELYIRFMTLGGGVLFLPEILCIYRKHGEQMVQTQTMDGLRDVLDLWNSKEYMHWPGWEIAGLVLSQCSSAIRGRGDISVLVDEIRRRHLWHRILPGIPEALWRKVVWGYETTDVVGGPHYEIPGNLDSALRLANAVLRSI
jgi:hypothetical protein